MAARPIEGTRKVGCWTLENHFKQVNTKTKTKTVGTCYSGCCRTVLALGVQQNVWIQRAVVWPPMQLIEGTELWSERPKQKEFFISELTRVRAILLKRFLGEVPHMTIQTTLRNIKTRRIRCQLGRWFARTMRTLVTVPLPVPKDPLWWRPKSAKCSFLVKAHAFRIEDWKTLDSL